MSIFIRSMATGGLVRFENGPDAELNNAVEFDSPFFVLPGDSGRCTVLTYPHTPIDPPMVLSVMLVEGGEPELDGLDGWQPVTGYSGQHGYSGPVMHASEYLGGGMARDLLSGELGAGWFVITSVESDACDDFRMHGQCTPDGGDCGRNCSEEPAGWILLHKPVDLTGAAS